MVWILGKGKSKSRNKKTSLDISELIFNHFFWESHEYLPTLLSLGDDSILLEDFHLSSKVQNGCVWGRLLDTNREEHFLTWWNFPSEMVIEARLREGLADRISNLAGLQTVPSKRQFPFERLGYGQVLEVHWPQLDKFYRHDIGDGGAESPRDRYRSRGGGRSYLGPVGRRHRACPDWMSGDSRSMTVGSSLSLLAVTTPADLWSIR